MRDGAPNTLPSLGCNVHKNEGGRVELPACKVSAVEAPAIAVETFPARWAKVALWLWKRHLAFGLLGRSREISYAHAERLRGTFPDFTRLTNHLTSRIFQ
jgi:hypothetical protein